MENKEQDRALQTPSEANTDKHINFRAIEDEDDTLDDSSDEDENKHDADSGNDSTNEMLQKEKLIDPGNEHTDRSSSDRSGGRAVKHDADSGGDGTGSMGSRPE